MLMVTVSALLGPAEAWLITLIALCSIVVGSGLLFWQHRVARRAQATRPATCGRFCRRGLKLDSEAAAVLRLMRAYVDAQERYSVCWRRPTGACRAWPPPKRSASLSSF